MVNERVSTQIILTNLIKHEGKFESEQTGVMNHHHHYTAFQTVSTPCSLFTIQRNIQTFRQHCVQCLPWSIISDQFCTSFWSSKEAATKLKVSCELTLILHCPWRSAAWYCTVLYSTGHSTRNIYNIFT